MMGLQLGLSLTAQQDAAGQVAPPPVLQLPSSSALTPHERKVQGDDWSWHIKDGVLHNSRTAETYVTAQSQADGAQVIHVFNSAGVFQRTVTVNDNVVTGFVPDDHNAPAMRFFGGVLHVAYAGHSDDLSLYVTRSTDDTPDNLTGTVQEIDNQESTTYAQFAELNGNLYLASRSGSQAWRMYVFDSGAGTWSFSHTIATGSFQIYTNLCVDGTHFRGIFWDHPTDSSEPERGEIKARRWQPADGTATLASMGRIYDPGANKGTRVLSVVPDGSALIFAEFAFDGVGDPIPTGQTYHVLRHDGVGTYDDPASWSKEDIGTNDYAFYESSNYVPGACFGDTDGNIIWMCEAASSGTTTISHGTRSGGTWTFAPLGVSGRPVVRPLADYATRGQAFMQYLDAYTDFRDADSSIFVMFSGDRDWVSTDFAAPLPPVAGLRKTPEIYQYFDAPDLDPVVHDFDLSLAQDGDLIVVVDTYRSSDPSDVSIGSDVMADEFAATASQTRAYVRSLVYNSSMGNTLTHDAAGAAPSFQSIMVCIVPGTYSLQAASATPAFQADDIVLGVGFSTAEAAAAHTHTPDNRILRDLRGSSVVTSFSAGVASGSGTAGVAGLGSGDPLTAFAVLREV